MRGRVTGGTGSDFAGAQTPVGKTAPHSDRHEQTRIRREEGLRAASRPFAFSCSHMWKPEDRDRRAGREAGFGARPPRHRPTVMTRSAGNSPCGAQPAPATVDEPRREEGLMGAGTARSRAQRLRAYVGRDRGPLLTMRAMVALGLATLTRHYDLGARPAQAMNILFAWPIGYCQVPPQDLMRLPCQTIGGRLLMVAVAMFGTWSRRPPLAARRSDAFQAPE